MKVTNISLVNALNILQKFGDKKFPQKINYAIVKNTMNFSDEYKIYDAQLKQLFESYKDHMTLNGDGEPETDNQGIPIVDDEVADEFNKELYDLLSFEVEIKEPYYVDKDVFDYDDCGKYDVLSARDIFDLQSVLCKPDKAEKPEGADNEE